MEGKKTRKVKVEEEEEEGGGKGGMMFKNSYFISFLYVLMESW